MSDIKTLLTTEAKDTTKQIRRQLQQHRELVKLARQSRRTIHAIEKLTGKPLGVSLSHFSNTLDFDNADRQQTLAIIKAFGGKWRKETHGQHMHYVQRLEPVTAADNQQPIGYRIYNAELPPSCRLVKKERVVPAQPQHTVTEYVVECSPNGKETAE